MSPGWICQQNRNLQCGYEEQKCNPKKPALHSHGIYNPEAFWGTWHRGPSTGTITADRYLLGTTPQNLLKSKILTQKWGRISREEHTDTFSHGPRAARRLVMLWQLPTASPLAGTGGIWGQQGQCLPPMYPLMGRGLSLPGPWGTAFCTGVLPRYAKENSLQGYNSQ